MGTYYNLPEEVIFCKKCVMSNQRPTSVPEFRHTRNRDGASYLQMDQEGICDACQQAKIKNSINWAERERELKDLLNKYRKNDGHYDCLVPGSGGKDSAFQAHVLRYKYGMHPLTCTWSPILYTDYGYQNFKKWIEVGGFDNVTFNQNGKVIKLLTRLSIENLLHPFQTFILGQKNFAPKLAAKLGIDLIFYGENEAEYGNPKKNMSLSHRENKYFSSKNYNNIYLAGLSLKKLEVKYKLSVKDLKPFLPLTNKEAINSKLAVHYLGYYLKWIPQEAYYFAVDKTNFQPRPFRTEGTYSKYNSIDDKLDDLHYYTTFIKFGIGRATYEASQELRNDHLTIEEGKKLIKKYDGEFPKYYFSEIMKYYNINENYFIKLFDVIYILIVF